MHVREEAKGDSHGATNQQEMKKKTKPYTKQKTWGHLSPPNYAWELTKHSGQRGSQPSSQGAVAAYRVVCTLETGAIPTETPANLFGNDHPKRRTFLQSTFMNSQVGKGCPQILNQ